MTRKATCGNSVAWRIMARSRKALNGASHRPPLRARSNRGREGGKEPADRGKVLGKPNSGAGVKFRGKAREPTKREEQNLQAESLASAEG